MKSALLVKRKGELSLSGESLTELMRAVLAAGKSFRFRAKGLSMSPFVRDGDILTVQPLQGSTPRRGDIVAFIHPGTGTVAVHRVVRAGAGFFYLKGDNAPDGDGGLPPESILGTVTRVERAGSKLRTGLRRTGPVIASLSRSGLLTKAKGAVRRARLRRTRRS
jgi:phage repressor protein C with HTH and peptisase S24 domain